MPDLFPIPTLASLPAPLLNPINLVLIPSILYSLFRIIYPSLSSTHADEGRRALPGKYDPSVYHWQPEAHPPVALWGRYGPADLAKYDGRGPGDGGRILLAIQKTGWGVRAIGEKEREEERTVFDVSTGRGFYGPDGMYGNFAGRDASRGMAKQSFDEDMLTPLDKPLDTLADLTPEEVENMRGWHEHFSRKYIVCGELVAQGQGDVST